MDLTIGVCGYFGFEKLCFWTVYVKEFAKSYTDFVMHRT